LRRKEEEEEKRKQEEEDRRKKDEEKKKEEEAKRKKEEEEKRKKDEEAKKKDEEEKRKKEEEEKRKKEEAKKQAEESKKKEIKEEKKLEWKVPEFKGKSGKYRIVKNHPAAKPNSMEIKLIVLGDSGVGKTNIISRYVNAQFATTVKTTVGVEFMVQNVEMNDGQHIKVTIWDTAGQERFRSITRSYYRKSQGAVVVYDNSVTKTVKDVHEWIGGVKEEVGDCEFMIAGNKSDLEPEPGCDVQAREIAKAQGATLAHVSAKTGENINAMFECLIASIYERTVKNSPPQASPSTSKQTSKINLDENAGKKKGGCC